MRYTHIHDVELLQHTNWSQFLQHLLRIIKINVCVFPYKLRWAGRHKKQNLKTRKRETETFS